MKSAFIFFLLIVFLLTGGNHPAHAGFSLVKSQVSGQASIKTLQQPGSENNQQSIFQSNNSSSEKQNDLLVLVADEDDEQEYISRKSFSHSIGVTAFFYAFILNATGNNTNCCSYAFTHPCFARSCKYLEQRSLRI